ncbi:MAG: hydroxyacid dehydrogenase [Desulfofustis sp. PB-SRB1]|jgi:D-3-phosphoglycerate dehydrogenase|nr:hydroxyacid dehydrogenase [Desulfofustis sp. PB-SRB1]MBM1001653.1 hydroxyacid dehydrogenase [Desulfofustis sp. PB-SRB1]HBH32841.1 hydroxyacid dehydrogenase [Desulfofustis sp.]
MPNVSGEKSSVRTPHKIVIAESIGFSPRAVRELEQIGAVYKADWKRQDLLAGLADTTILWVRLRNLIDQQVIDAAPRLRYIVTATTGLNHIDVEYAQTKGITIVSLRGEALFLRTVRASAEHTVALILALLRKIPAASASVCRGNWQRDFFKGNELYERTVGIVGFGRIGRLVANYLLAFGSSVLTTDPLYRPAEGLTEVTPVSLETLLERSDIVSLHVDYKPENKRFFGFDAFQSMKNTAYFINTSRGELVDEMGLLRALEDQEIQGAALDVLAGETGVKTAEHPLVVYSRTHENLLITPHIGGCTHESMEKTELFMLEKLERMLRNQGDYPPCAV